MNRKKLKYKLKAKKLYPLVFLLLQKNLDFDESTIKETKDKETKDYPHIRCPKCNWQPKKESLWFCSNCDAPEYFYEACGTAWNTFDTGGKCPGCKHQWRWTSCLSCSQWSLHNDWYLKKTK